MTEQTRDYNFQCLPPDGLTKFIWKRKNGFTPQLIRRRRRIQSPEVVCLYSQLLFTERCQGAWATVARAISIRLLLMKGC